MGISIHLHIAPERIGAKEWKAAYEETLRLIGEYPFIDIITEERNGIRYLYTKRTAHRACIDGKGFDGWRSAGDMASGVNTGDFYLYSRIEAYRYEELEEDNGRDILLNQLQEADEEAKVNVCYDIWGGETHGADSHIYLLAVGCLLADRFPDGVMVWGDITKDQCEQAVSWANQYLERKIEAPVTCRGEALLRRLKKSGLTGEEILAAFMKLTLERKDCQMGELIRERLLPEVIYRYYRKRFSYYEDWSRAGFIWELREYKEMGYDFKSLQCMLIGDSEGNRLTIEEYRKAVMKMKRLEGLTVLEGNGGMENAGNSPGADVGSYEELIRFTPDCRVSPEMEEAMKVNFKILHKMAEKGFEEFQTYTREQRENYFLKKSSRYILLHETVWSRIFDRIMEDDYIKRYYGLFCVNVFYKKDRDICRALFRNPDVIDYYWEKTAGEER